MLLMKIRRFDGFEECVPCRISSKSFPRPEAAPVLLKTRPHFDDLGVNVLFKTCGKMSHLDVPHPGVLHLYALGTHGLCGDLARTVVSGRIPCKISWHSFHGSVEGDDYTAEVSILVRLLGLVKDIDCIVTPRRSCVIGGIMRKLRNFVDIQGV